MGPFGCFSCDTEFLAPTGWVRFDQYNGDLVAQYHPENRYIEFVTPIEYVKLPQESMIHLHSRRFDHILSPEHRIFYRSKYNKLTSITAEELYNRERCCKHIELGRIPTTFKIPKHSKAGLRLSDNELRLHVALHFRGRLEDEATDTYFFDMRGIKTNRRERVFELLAILGISYSRVLSAGGYDRCLYFTGFRLPLVFNEIYWNASPHQLKVIRQELIDYWVIRDKRYRQYVYRTNDQKSIGFIQYMLAACGERSSIRSFTTSGFVYHDVRFGFKESYIGLNLVNDKHLATYVNSEDGFKYCFRVPTELLVVRRNGRIIISHNTGKSTTAMAEAKFRAEAQAPNSAGVRKTRGAMVRNTEGMLWTTTIKTFKYWFPLFYVQKTPYNHCWLKYKMPDGTKVECEIIFLALNRPQDVDQLMSFEFTWIFINEAKTIPYAIFETARARIGRYPPKTECPITWHGIFMDTNPPPELSWYNRLAEYTYYHDPHFAKISQFFKYEDPPIIKGPDGDWIENPKADYIHIQPLGAQYWIDMAAGQTQNFINVNILGKYGSINTGKPVYQEFEENHVAKEKIEYHPQLPVLVGWDYGVKNAVVFCQLYPGMRLFVLHEIYAGDHGLDHFIQEYMKPYIANTLSRHVLINIGDPSGTYRSPGSGVTSQDILASHGLPTISTSKSQDPEVRISSVQYFLYPCNPGYPKFLVNPTCSILIAGFRGEYHYAQKNVSGYMEEYREVPTKNMYSHVHDALQYVAYYARFPQLYQTDAIKTEESEGWAGYV